MLTFIATFSLIFLSEMGDKTQFIAMICSAKYGWKKVMTAIVIAVTSNHLLAVFFGQWITRYISHTMLSGGVLILFGISSLYEELYKSKENTFQRKLYKYNIIFFPCRNG